MGRLLALALVFHAVSAAVAGGPLDRELDRLAGKQTRLVRKLTAPLGEGELAAVLLQTAGGRARTSLHVYHVTAARVKLLYLEPGFSKEVRLAGIHARGTIPDLNGDGSRIVAYITERKNIGQSTLIVLRYANGELKRLADFPTGHFADLNEDGRQEIVTRSLPLGKFFNVSCEEVFHSLAQNAYRSRIYAWKGGEYAAVSKDYPGFFSAEIAATEARLGAVDLRAAERYGDYLGDALSLYFLHEELGEKRVGWDKFVKLFKIRATDIPPVKRCYQKLRGELREKLAIPADW